MDYELLDNAPEHFHGIAAFIRWSTNYDFPSPLSLFLDIIGYSEEVYGERLSADMNFSSTFGYLECDMLGVALIEYAKLPKDAFEFIEQVLTPDEDDTSESA